MPKNTIREKLRNEGVLDKILEDSSENVKNGVKKFIQAEFDSLLALKEKETEKLLTSYITLKKGVGINAVPEDMFLIPTKVLQILKQDTNEKY